MIRISTIPVCLALLGVVACGRSGFVTPHLEAYVSGPGESLVPGAAGVLVEVAFVNQSGGDLELLTVELDYAGPGSPFTAALVQEVSALPDAATTEVQFRVQLPAGVEGTGTIDVSADYYAADLERSFRLSDADQPFTFTYLSPDEEPDLTALSTLWVTTATDELDGGATLEQIADAGGADDLSLREALTIVQSSGEPHRIAFDPVSFPEVSPPTQQITLGPLPAITVTSSAIDGRGAGVYLIGAELDLSAPNLVVRDLSILAAPSTDVIDLSGAADAWLSRISIDYDDFCFVGIDISGSDRVVLRDVEVLTCNLGVRLNGSDAVLIDQSQINTGLQINDSSGVLVRDSTLSRVTAAGSPATVVSGSIFSAVADVSAFRVEPGSDGSVFADNFVSDRSGNSNRPLVRVIGSRLVSVRRNVIRELFAEPIALESGANDGIAPPVVTSVTADRVAGTTAAVDDSEVEVFSGLDGDLTELLGVAIVEGGAFAIDGLAIASDQSVVATVTDPAGNTSQASTPVPVTPVVP